MPRWNARGFKICVLKIRNYPCVPASVLYLLSSSWICIFCSSTSSLNIHEISIFKKGHWLRFFPIRSERKQRDSAAHLLFENWPCSTQIGEMRRTPYFKMDIFQRKLVGLRRTPHLKMNNLRRKLVALRRTQYLKIDNFRRKLVKLRLTPHLKWTTSDENWWNWGARLIWK